MRSFVCLGAMASVVALGAFSDPADAVGRNGRIARSTLSSAQSNGLGANGLGANGLAANGQGSGYIAWLTTPNGSDARAARRNRNGNGRRVATQYGSLSFSNVNFTAESFDRPRGMSAREAGTFTLRDNAKPVFLGARRADGVGFFERIGDRGGF